ncbi:Thiosulfate sulfurtransferase [Geodia barretti]|uniref:Thiosulfate sulfurtransferase n=1 Tax=Geodia barretti TaxID=519541 RepID=A0AA35RF11_GEOBA|nr:Thiosulfate sulfurtransferase [Geodia barretti]
MATSDDRGVRHLTDTFTEELRNAGIYGNEHVVTYENSLNTLYGASCRALYILRLLGHPRVSVLGGGYEGWVQDGHHTSSEIQQTVRGSFQPKWTPSMWKGKTDVAEAMGDPNTVLLDVIVYCFKGARASNTYLALKDAGFENVSNYFASWNEWSRDDKLEIDSKLL